MTKKRLILIATLPLAIIVTVGVLAMLPSSSGVTKATFDRIKDGMTRAEVQEILRDNPEEVRTGGAYRSCGWRGDDGSVVLVVLFLDDTVVDMRWRGPSETILDKIRRCLGLPLPPPPLPGSMPR